MKPTTMLYRNLMAMDVEETLRANPLDGVVLLTGCDKTNPASIMGAASANLPTVVVTGGPMLNGHWRGRNPRLVQRLLALPRGASRREHHAGGLAGARGRDLALPRPLHDDGDRVHDGVHLRGARACAAGHRGDPGRRLAAQGGGRAGGARGRRPGTRDLTADILTREAFENAIRVAARDLRLDQRDPPPDRVRGPGRGRPPAAALRRSLRVDALARRPEAGRPAPDGGLLLRGRAAGRA